MTTARPGLPYPCSPQAKTRDESSRRGERGRNVTGKAPLEICKFQTRGKCWVYSAVNHPWWVSMLFHRRVLLWLGSAVRYIWWQRWDDDNRQTGVALPM